MLQLWAPCSLVFLSKAYRYYNHQLSAIRLGCIAICRQALAATDILLPCLGLANVLALPSCTPFLALHCL